MQAIKAYKLNNLKPAGRSTACLPLFVDTVSDIGELKGPPKDQGRENYIKAYFLCPEIKPDRWSRRFNRDS